jgi:AmmeMemoRadiSam system protein A
MLSKMEKLEILGLARKSMAGYIENGIILKYKTADMYIKQHAGAFVTIHKDGRLRGCIGMIESNQPLYETIIEMSIEASTGDPRFEPVKTGELNDIEIEVSVLSHPQKISSLDEIILGRHGVIVRRGRLSGVFLPQVATETGWSKQEFMRNLCEGKAGLPEDSYLDKGTDVYIFEAEVFNEKELKDDK